MKTLFLLLLVSSCSSYVRTQSTKMLSPESQGGLGKGQLEIRLEAQKRDKIDFSDDTTKNAVDRAETPYASAFAGELGIFNIVDFYVQPHIGSSTVLGLKLQVLGKGKAEANKGNFSTSFILGYGGSSKQSQTDGVGTFFNDNIKKIEIESSHNELGIISGYRWSEKFLHYVNFIYQHLTVEGQVTNNSGTLNEAPFKYRQDGIIYSTGFIHYFAKAHWKLDYSYFVSDWSRTQKQTVNSINTSIGFDW